MFFGLVLVLPPNKNDQKNLACETSNVLSLNGDGKKVVRMF